MMIENKSMGQLREQRTKLQVEYQDLLRIYKPAFPKMQQLKASIDEIDKKIKEESDIVRRSIEGTYKVAVQQEASVVAKLESSKKDVLDLQDRSIRYNILKREVDTNRQLYDGLLQRLKEVGVEAGVGTNNVTVVDSALTPIAPFKPNLTLNLQIAAVLGLMLGIGLVFFLEYLDDTHASPRGHGAGDAPAGAGRDSAGQVQEGDRTLRRSGLLSHLDARSTFAEAYRSVRTALQFSTREGAPRQIVVTSTTAKEGKSTTAVCAGDQLRAGRPAGAADRRRPAQSVAAHAAGRRQQPRAVELPVERPAGARRRAHHDGSEPVLSFPPDRCRRTRSSCCRDPSCSGCSPSWASGSRRIIIDSPPVLGIADALVLGNQVGSVLFVVAAGSTRKAHLRAALKRLRQAGDRADRRVDDQGQPARRHRTATRARTTTTRAPTMRRSSPEACRDGTPRAAARCSFPARGGRR